MKKNSLSQFDILQKELIIPGKKILIGKIRKATCDKSKTIFLRSTAGNFIMHKIRRHVLNLHLQIPKIKYFPKVDKVNSVTSPRHYADELKSTNNIKTKPMNLVLIGRRYEGNSIKTQLNDKEINIGLNKEVYKSKYNK